MFVSPINTLSMHFTSQIKSSESSRDNFCDGSYRAIKMRLDNYKGEFVTPSGKEVNGTVKDYIKACMLEDIKTIDAKNMLHGTSTKEVREMIMRGGFDPEHIHRTLAGPGVCFTGDEHIANSLGGSCLIRADFSGKSTALEHGFYNGIESNDGFSNAVKKALFDTGSKVSPSYINDRYVRDVLVYDLGIDAARDPGKHPCYPQCFAVYNTDKIYNIRPNEHSYTNRRTEQLKKTEDKPKKDELPPNQHSYYWGY